MDEKNLDLFWYWINERHRIFIKRMHGDVKPWTTDPILLDYKFTNVFRELDTGTIWLRQNFREPYRDREALLLFNIAWYRLFNLIDTSSYIGWIEEWDRERVLEKLSYRYKNNIPIFTSAHIVRGWNGEQKFRSIVKVMDVLWEEKENLCRKIRRSNTLHHAVSLFKEIDLIGGFLAYEIVSDLRHTVILENAVDIMTWANPGPGCKRGLLRLVDYLLGDEHAIALMLDLLHMSLDKKETHVPDLEMRDIEHSLCEFSKYMKVKLGEGRPRCRYEGRL